MEESSPIRIVADGRLRLHPGSKLVNTAHQVPTWLVTSNGADRTRLKALSKAGITTIEVEADAAGHPNPTAVASALAARGLTRILIEGGGKLTASYLSADLVDRIVWFHAPKLIGGDGLPAAHSFGVDYLAKAPLFLRTGIAEIGDDIVETYTSANGPQKCSPE
jgi:diaminohydroxyphosphoribosylaminopyrimidine deaminase/5-amino-6-(5-phosphoribosylamino)uracil reductase